MTERTANGALAGCSRHGAAQHRTAPVADAAASFAFAAAAAVCTALRPTAAPCGSATLSEDLRTPRVSSSRKCQQTRRTDGDRRIPRRTPPLSLSQRIRGGDATHALDSGGCATLHLVADACGRMHATRELRAGLGWAGLPMDSAFPVAALFRDASVSSSDRSTCTVMVDFHLTWSVPCAVRMVCCDLACVIDSAELRLSSPTPLSVRLAVCS